MRWLCPIVVVASCASPPAPAVPRQPIVVADDGMAACPEPPEPAPTADRSDIRRELDAVDRELDAIDEELAASAVAGPQTRDDGVATVEVRRVAVQQSAPDRVLADAPALVLRAANAYDAARAAEAKLGGELGPRHPQRIAAQRAIEWQRLAFETQRRVELDEAAATQTELAKLTKTATPPQVRAALRRGLRQVLAASASGEPAAPSDAPASVRIAIVRVLDLTNAIAAQAGELGPKHPEMIRLSADLAAARDKLRAAFGDADAALAKEIAALDRLSIARTGTPPPIDPAKLARRAELAERARDLRRELDAR